MVRGLNGGLKEKRTGLGWERRKHVHTDSTKLDVIAETFDNPGKAGFPGLGFGVGLGVLNNQTNRGKKGTGRAKSARRKWRDRLGLKG